MRKKQNLHDETFLSATQFELYPYRNKNDYSTGLDGFCPIKLNGDDLNFFIQHCYQADHMLFIRSELQMLGSNEHISSIGMSFDLPQFLSFFEQALSSRCHQKTLNEWWEHGCNEITLIYLRENPLPSFVQKSIHM